MINAWWLIIGQLVTGGLVLFGVWIAARVVWSATRPGEPMLKSPDYRDLPDNVDDNEPRDDLDEEAPAEELDENEESEEFDDLR